MTNEQIFHAKIKELANNPDAYNAYSQLPELFDTVSPGDKLNLFESLDRFEIADLSNVKELIDEEVEDYIANNKFEMLEAYFDITDLPAFLLNSDLTYAFMQELARQSNAENVTDYLNHITFNTLDDTIANLPKNTLEAIREAIAKHDKEETE